MLRCRTCPRRIKPRAEDVDQCFRCREIDRRPPVRQGPRLKAVRVPPGQETDDLSASAIEWVFQAAKRRGAYERRMVVAR